MRIASNTNEKVKYWVKLKDKKFKDSEKKFLIEGDHLVNLALEKGLVDTLIVLEDNYNFDNTYVVTKEIMKKISSQVSPSNIIAVVNMFTTELSDENIIILDNVQDPGNVGTIIRSALAFGFENIIFGTGTCDVFNEKVLRASEGMIFSINFKKEDLTTYLDDLRSRGYKIIGTDVNSGDSIKSYVNDKVAIIIGNEGKGINPLLKCDHYVKIPMDSKCESLNAGVSASILMYEVYNGK